MTVMDLKVSWLGQAGFSIEGSGTTVVIDPYLSDLCSAVHGLDRVTPAPITPSELGANVVLVTHWHEDHLDLDSAVEFIEDGAIFVAPPSCVARLAGIGISPDKLIPISSGQTVSLADVVVTAVGARHRVPGFITEDAVGFILEVDSVRIYHSGDTEYNRALLMAADRGLIDLALLCCNGTGGNMNAIEAAMLASQLNPKLVIPMHFGMWNEEGYGPGATLNPVDFLDFYGLVRPGAPAAAPMIREPIWLKSGK